MGWLGTPVWAQQQLVELDWNTKVRWALWLLVGFFGVFPGIVAYMVWLERKVAARFQDRIGPNRVGPLGLLQPIADALKLITKEDLVPRTADKWVHLAAPVLVIVSAFLVIAVIPFAVGMAPVNLPSGLVYLIAVSSISPLGIFLAGWSSRNKYSLLGAMRSVAQLVSYEVPQVLSTIPIILWTGSLSLVSIFDKQLEYGWFIASPPGLLAFGILLIASIAEVNRTPFDLPEAESEIIAGYHTEYSSMRFGLFFLAEYLSVFAISCLATALFLGGGTLDSVRELSHRFSQWFDRDDRGRRPDPAARLLWKGLVFHLLDVLDQGHLAPDAGRPADELRVEIPGSSGDPQRLRGRRLVRDRDPARSR